MPDFAGLVARVGLSYEIGDTMQVSVTADRDLDYSFETFDPYFVVDGIGGSVRRQLGGRFDVGAGIRRDRYSYRSLAGTAAALQSSRHDTIRSYSGSLGFRLRRGVRLGFGGTYFDRTSNRSSSRKYQGLRLGTSVTYAY